MNQADRDAASALAMRMDEAELRKLRTLLHRVAECGVETDHGSYFTVEIPRSLWNELAPYS